MPRTNKIKNIHFTIVYTKYKEGRKNGGREG
jgi:hypothetical protein